MSMYHGTFVPHYDEIHRELGDNAFKHPKSSKAVTLVPIFKEFIADLETPVSTYLKLKTFSERNGSYPACLLESVEGGERLARYSFIGFMPYRTLICGQSKSHAPIDMNCHTEVVEGDPLVHLERAMGEEVAFCTSSTASKLPEFYGGAIGYVSYDAVKYFEPRTSSGIEAQEDAIGVPEAVFMMFDQVVIFDHVRHTIKVLAHLHVPNDANTHPTSLNAAYTVACDAIDAVCHYLGNPTAALGESAYLPPPESPARLGETAKINTKSNTKIEAFDWEKASNMGRSTYEDAVRHLKQHIYDGDIIQAVPSHRIRREISTQTSAFQIYRQLRVVNPSPYMFYLDIAPGFQIVGASPEMLVKVGLDGKVYTHPIAGTRRRGATPEEDERLAAELLADEKERAEHVMLVDLGRNDVGRVSAPGTVRVESLMHIERYSHVMHIVSNVSGRLAPGKTCYDAFRSIFPAGTVSGAPKVKAIELVSSLEKEKRHVYAGSVGYVGFSGVMDTAIAIRTIVVKDSVAYLQAGAGIVYDSIPSAEYDETIAKMRAVIRAVDAACEPAGDLPLLTRS